MTPEQMAACHARAFGGAARPWTESEFAALLDSPHVFAAGDARAFALARAVADEAELLTIATDPCRRRQGLARQALGRIEAMAAQRGAQRMFLEVADDNRAAIALYRASGYHRIARRSGYYEAAGGRTDAVIMQKAIA